MEKAELNRLISTHRIALVDGDKLRAVRVRTEEQKNALINAKDEIVAELVRRNEEKAKKIAEEEAEYQRLLSSQQMIRVRWQTGDPLSAYVPAGEGDRRALEHFGLTQSIGGWGTKVEGALVDALGTEFLASAVEEYLRPAREAREQEERLAAGEEAAKFEQAKKTGSPVLLERWTEPCNDPREECSMDVLRTYANPDGTTTTKRSHTW